MSGLLKKIDMAYIRRRLTGEPSAAQAKEQLHTAAAKHRTAGDALRDPETVKCPKCGRNLDKQRVITHKYICYECGAYFRVRTNNRIRMIADPGTFEEWNRTMPLSNPLNYEGYPEKLAEVREKTGLEEGFTVGKCRIFGEEAVVGVCDSRFMMASMGHVIGEKVTSAIERATSERLPVFIFCCSGGARMQEGMISLMQMAKTSAAIKKHGDAGLLYCTILTDPTTGGVTASFAMLGDVIIAEPGALIGFAGARVIKQTTGEDLPEGFQTAEFLLEHGFLDGIVQRRVQKKFLYFLIKSHQNTGKKSWSDFDEKGLGEILGGLTGINISIGKKKSAWEKVKGVRNIERPSAFDYMDTIFDIFVEAHGDRCYGDDGAIVGGVGFIDSQPVTVIADIKGSSAQECVERNFGMPMPEGYRKALRLMKQAEKFNRPIISFVNTAGAFCGAEAEKRGQGEAIARSLMEMSALKVPVLCILIGEGGSGGALATAVGNEVWMLENATYSILSPEGFASILWKDAGRAKEASEVMNITAQDLKRLKVIDKIVPEYGGADKDTKQAIGVYLKEGIKHFLKKYDGMEPEMIAEERYKRFRAY